jgi:hypothetical protein
MVTVRAAGTGASRDAYAANFGEGEGDQIKFIRIDDGAKTLVYSSGVSVAESDVVLIEAEGTSIRIYKNGAQAGTTQTDSVFTTGQPGFGGRYTGYDVFDDWGGGDLGGGTTLSPSFAAMALAGTTGRLGFTINMPDEV